MLEPHPRLPVTEQGVVIPKVWLGDASMVEVRQENGHLVVEPVSKTSTDAESSLPTPVYDPDDPIWKWGSDPITDDPITDGSINLDRYLYGPSP